MMKDKSIWIRRVIAYLLVVTMISGYIDMEGINVGADITEDRITLFFVDNTDGNWVKNDNAVMELVDNTGGHVHYDMVRQSDTVWKVQVPESAGNITFNRYDSGKKTQWNSWSAGGRDGNNAYYADGSEFGHWEYMLSGIPEENYFHFGDIIYLDVSEFTEWENDDALMYVNFTDATKEENGGKDVILKEWENSDIYQPQIVNYEVASHIYACAVTKQDEGKTCLRFFRGNETALWNCSVLLTYEEYRNGHNCIKIKDWDNQGYSYAYTVDYADDDGDGLPNFYEELIHSDKYNADSDGDGLPDGYEIFTTLTSPVKADTDGNGISDGDEDFDKDGLSNREEYKLGINPMSFDTDGDGLGDDSELKYKMNPNDQDTLDDGIIDGDRIFDIKYDGQAPDNPDVTMHLSVELCGRQVDSMSVEPLGDDEPFLNSSVPGYIANGYELHVDGTFDEAILSFELGDELINDSGLEPVIYYWNEETQLLEEVENQYADGNKICTKLEHFSKYILLSKNRHQQEAFQFTIAAPSGEENLNKTFDVAFVLDESGSIGNIDFSAMKTQCMNLADKLADTDRLSVFTFDEAVRRISSFTDIESAKEVLNTLVQHNGATAIYDAVYTASDEFAQKSGEAAARIMILVTDGYNNYGRISLDTAIEYAVSNNVVIYTVGVGNVNAGELTSIAGRTGGAYYPIDNFTQLEAIFNRIISEADLYRDSDGDGISDYHEKKIAAGELCTGSGEALNLCSTMNYLSADSDGDGMSDGEEVVIKELPSGNYYCYLYSNPCMADTDSDGYDDYVENYIGTSPISKLNVVKAGTSTDDFKLNNWYEWQQLIEEHAWNYIHNLVQEDAVRRNTGVTAEYYIKNVGRADLYRQRTRELWEVKPSSYSHEPNQSKGIEQLKNYVRNVEDGKIGEEYIKNNTFTTADEEYTITYKNMMNGLIVYNFKKNRKKTDPEYAVEKEKETEKDRDYVYEPQVAAHTVTFWGTLLGVAIVGGTIVEDVFSGGAGIADDAPSFALAYELIFGY